jgi:Sporulation and spore germination
MPRNVAIALAVLAVSVGIGVASWSGLQSHIRRLANAQSDEEKARHEVLAKPIATPSDATTKAQLFWIGSGGDTVAPVLEDMALSADPVERSQQLLRKLIADPPAPEQRTLPADSTILGFYVLADGTAVADFSDTISAEMPSGILSEKLAVDSIVDTLRANVPAIQRLKIVIHGQEVDTLAGHVDLTGFFDVSPDAPQQSADAIGPGGVADSPAGQGREQEQCRLRQLWFIRGCLINVRRKRNGFLKG